MKHKFIIFVAFTALTLAFNSCEPLGTCKRCRKVTYDMSGKILLEDQEAEYCDAALFAVEIKDDIFINNTRISWECR
jgi:hypothetical protein